MTAKIARATYVGFRLTPAEHAALERAAQKAHMSRSAYVRLALRDLLSEDRVVEVRILGTLDAHTRIPLPNPKGE